MMRATLFATPGLRHGIDLAGPATLVFVVLVVCVGLILGPAAASARRRVTGALLAASGWAAGLPAGDRPGLVLGRAAG